MSCKLISASAGSGKTYYLSLEYIKLLINNPNLSFSQISVITFTRKATSEIRERILDFLQILTSDEKDKVLLKNISEITKKKITTTDIENLKTIYLEMLSNKSDISISTIDSFIQKLFNNTVAPNLGIGNYDISNIDEDFEEIFNKLCEDKKLFSLLKGFISESRSIYNLKSFVQDIILNYFEIDYSQKMNKQELSMEGYESVVKKFCKLIELIDKERDIKFLKKPYVSIFGSDSVDNMKDKLLDKDFIKQNYKYFLLDKPFWKINSFSKLKHPNLFLMFEKFKESLSTYLFINYAVPEHNLIKRIAKKVINEYEKIKLKKRVFSHSDILHLSYKYLVRPMELSSHFYEDISKNTRYILIDEFQDTSLIQFWILLPLIKEILSGSGQKDYGGVVFVGDPKQSLYNWRGGEVELLLKMPNIIPQIKKQKLLTSYRSDKQIVDFVNNIFSSDTLITNLKKQKVNWDFTKLNSINSGGFVSAYLTEKRVKDEESEFVKKVIVPSYNKNLGTCAIITRLNKSLDKIADSLKLYRIPFVIHSSQSLFEHRLVKSILFLLRYFVSNDILFLLRFLRSDIVLLSPNDLKEIINKTPREKLQKYPQQIMNWIDEIEKEIFVKDTILKIVEKFNIPTLFPTDADMKNLEYFISIISKDQSIQSFLEYIDSSKKDYQLRNFQSGDSITLLTIHKSKGLEFETVFFFYKKSRIQNNKFYKYVHYSDDFSFIKSSIFSYNYSIILKHIGFDDKKKLYEEVNNFYVALTRAKHNLFIGFFSGYKPITKDSNFPNSLINSIINYFFPEYSRTKIINISKGELVLKKKEQKEKEERFDYSYLKLLQDKKIEKIDKFFSFDIVNKKLYGEMIHLYLSHLKTNTLKEQKYALKMVYRAYTSYFSKSFIDKSVKNIQRKIENNYSYLFDLEKWTNIYCEYQIFYNNIFYRLDRLLINSYTKTALIIDYKTGETMSKKQLKNYKLVVLSILPNYFIKTKFIIF